MVFYFSNSYSMHPTPYAQTSGGTIRSKNLHKRFQ
jgi:hypothetical protein